MQMELQPSETKLLVRILTEYLSDLRMEIRDTEDHNLRQEMKDDEGVVKSIVARLREVGGQQKAA
jgi:hypothetical protein